MGAVKTRIALWRIYYGILIRHTYIQEPEGKSSTTVLMPLNRKHCTRGFRSLTTEP